MRTLRWARVWEVCDHVCAPVHVTYKVECARVPVCVPGGRREVLAASLGTYKPCGRICLRCQLKAFSNVHPTPSPGMGEVSELRNPILPPAHQPPCLAWGHSWSLHHPFLAQLSPGGPGAERGKAAAAAPPSPGEGQASRPFQATIL